MSRNDEILDMIMMNRRIFLRNTGIAFAGAWVIPSATSCCGKHPNDLITIRMIGTGSQGIDRNLAHYLKYPEYNY